MWRRYIYKIAPTRKTVTRHFADDSDNKMKEFEIKESKNKDDNKEFDMKHDSKDEKFKDYDSSLSVENQTEILRRREEHVKEEHIILFGKRGSGIELVRDSLLGTNDGNTCISTAQKEVKGYNEQFERKVKITSLYSDYGASLSPNDLSSLSISEEYSVVFCFPVSYRFTTEDQNLLEKYLQHRQREDFKKVTVAFTYSERLEGEPKDFICNLPDELKESSIHTDTTTFLSAVPI
ncbi:unnamed protein product [Mytilus edulis]|uniref:AIG1-type G domain-containing protein n=1 Tax=Mytilus edulis TaxID=6550 RepID=A0A8S3T156_MYTED|nr:unnamed protein product [Mytilus edulis]